MLSNFKIKPRTLLRGLATAAADPAANPNRVHGGLKIKIVYFKMFMELMVMI